MHFGLESSAFMLRVSVVTDELMLGLESSTFRVRVMVRIPSGEGSGFSL